MMSHLLYFFLALMVGMMIGTIFGNQKKTYHGPRASDLLKYKFKHLPSNKCYKFDIHVVNCMHMN